MTVKELIEKLQEMPQDADVVLEYDYEGIQTIHSYVGIVFHDDHYGAVIKENVYG